MDAFLAWLEKYDLLIELIITVLTISLSLLALFQTKNIAKRQLKQEENISKQQADLQERQIKISVYEQKNEINKALNIVFDSVSQMSLLFKSLKAVKFGQNDLDELLNGFVEGINFENISYTLEQSRFFMEEETYTNIRIVKSYFSIIKGCIECLNILKENDELRRSNVENIKNACAKIEEVQPLIKSAMLEELKLERR